MAMNPLNIFYADFPGSEADLRFLQDDAWLVDSAVNSWIIMRKGRHHVAMVMAWVQNPMRLVCRYLQHYPTLEKAILHADLFCRTAQKDERGTLQIHWNDWNICIN
jgi:hypothetical protein